MAASGACEVVDEKKAKRMTKHERFLLKKTEDEKVIDEQNIELDEKRRDMLSKLPSKLRARLEAKFISKAQREAYLEGKQLSFLRTKLLFKLYILI